MSGWGKGIDEERGIFILCHNMGKTRLVQVQMQTWPHDNECSIPYCSRFMVEFRRISHYCLMFGYIMQPWVSNIFSIFNSMVLINYLTSPFLSFTLQFLFWYFPSACQFLYHFLHMVNCRWVSVASEQKSAFSWIFVSLYAMCHFSLVAFKISSLYLAFSSLNHALGTICLYLFCLELSDIFVNLGHSPNWGNFWLYSELPLGL